MSRFLVAVAVGALLLLPSAASAVPISFEQDPASEYATGASPYRLVGADFDGDGKTDIATENGSSSDVSVFLKNPGFGFAQEQGSPVHVGGPSSGPSAIVAGDWNGDGRIDLATSNYSDGTITSLIRQQGGGFTLEANESANGLTSAIAVGGDYNADGKTDLLITSRTLDTLWLMQRRPGNNGFVSVANNIGSGISTPRAIAVANFVTSTAKPDVIVTNPGNDTIKLFRSEPTTVGPTWWSTFANYTENTDDNPQEIVTADFNNDGKPDVAVSNYKDGVQAGSVRVYTGNGSDLDPEGAGILVGKGPQGIAAGDFDKDGRIDIAVANHESDTVSILRRNDLNTGFDAPITIPTFDGPNGVITGEFTGDSQPDIAVTSDNVSKLRVITNVTLGQPVNLTRPQVTGVPQVGSQLSCSSPPATWKNGGPPTTYTMVWERAPRSTVTDGDAAWAPINGANGENYTVQADDAGSRVHCRVDAVNAGGSATGYSTSLRADSGPPANTRVPQTLGIPIKGQTLTCDPGDWTNGPTFSYRWLSDGQAIAGATGKTYAATQEDNRVGCEVTADNDVAVAPAVAANTLHVVSRAPLNTVAPTLSIDGDVNKPIGRTATCGPGTWAYDDAQYTYRWTRNGETIAGEILATHKVTVDDLGETLQCFATSTNPVGPTEAASNQKLVKLPAGTLDAEFQKSSPRNEFDPINMLAISKDYKDAVGSIVIERLKNAVATATESCKKRSDLPDKLPNPFNRGGGFSVSTKTRCIALVLDPGNVDVGTYGVQYKNFSDRKCSVPGKCASLHFFISPVDPKKPGTLTDAQLARLDAATPEKVLWDLNRDGKTDAECPASAPVLRTMLGSGTWGARAIIVAKDSDETGIFGSANSTFELFAKPYKTLRKNQAFACRTSLEPPPDPQQGPCVTKGTIGRVQVTGNLCPVYLRALDPKAIQDLPPDVFKLLKTMAEQLALHKARDNGVGVSVVDDTPTMWRAAAQSSAIDQGTVATFANMASSLTSIQNVPSIDLGDATQKAIDKGVPNYNAEKGNFALDQIYLTQGTAKVNGVNIVPNSSIPTLLVPSDAGNAISTIKSMTINNPDAQEVLGGLQLAKGGQLNSQIPDEQSAQAAVLKQVNLDALRKELQDKADTLLNIGPFKLSGTEAKVDLANDGTATLTAKAALPLLTDPGTGQPISMDITLKGDVNGNLKLQGVTLRAPGVLLGPLKLKNLLLRYDNGIQIQGQILLGPSGVGVDIRNFELGPKGQFKSLILDYLAGVGQGIPVGPGVFLTKVGGGFDAGPPFRLNAAATVSVGPSAGGGCPTAGIDAQLNLLFGGKPDFVIDVDGTVEVVCIPLIEMKFHADSSGYVRIDGHLGINAGPLNVSADIGAAFALPNWQLTASASLSIRKLPIIGTIGPIGGELALSNRGLAGCVKVRIPLIFTTLKLAAGAAVSFPGGVPPLSFAALIANLHFFTGCDLSAYKPLGRRMVARGAQAGASQFTLPKFKGVTLLSVEGAGGAPRVKLTSPSGKVYDLSQGTGPVKYDVLAGQIVDDEDRDVVLINNAEAGRWTATPADGSPTVARVQISHVIPDPSVTAKAAGLGSSRTLSYNVKDITGQVVRFIEYANGGTKTIGTVNGGGRGTFKYTPSEAKARKRTVVAQVTQDGIPRKSITVASYTAPNPTVGRPAGVKVKRSGSRAIITWKKASLAVNYLVSVKSSDGGRTGLFPDSGKTQVVMPGVAGNERLSVSVTSVSNAGRKGAAGRATLAALKSKKKKGKK